MARCARYILMALNCGINSSVRGISRNFNLSSQQQQVSCLKYGGSLTSPHFYQPSLLNQNNSFTIQNFASLHTLCKSSSVRTDGQISTNEPYQPNQLLKKCIKVASVPARNGTGSRGSMPHPTANIPIAVIGPNCQLDTTSAGWANELLITLDPDMRHQLFDALREYEAMIWSPGKEAELEAQRAARADKEERLTAQQLRQLAIYSGIPFIGFGTLDNLIMISAGEYIDTTFGAMLGISTMAAAALGNMVSDVVGLGTAGYVENISRRMGITPPKMSPAQLDMTSTKLTSNLGRVIGVLIGCTIGMTPLFFLSRDEDEDENESGESSSEDVTSSPTPGVEATTSQTDDKDKKNKDDTKPLAKS